MGIAVRLALACLALLPTPARAAGGGHLVDDAAVETPGDCNASAVGQYLGSATQDYALALACTPLNLPHIEFGAAVLWGNGDEGSLLDPALKLVLHNDDRLAVALTGTLAIGLESGRVEAARLVMPVSITLADTLDLNLNAGLVHIRDSALQGYFGAQLITAIAPALSLTSEAFVETDGDPGVQAGLRFTPGKGRADFDIYLGHRIDGESDFSAGLGLIVRF